MIFFHKESKYIFFWGGGGRGVAGWRRVGYGVDGWTDKLAQTNLPLLGWGWAVSGGGGGGG